ncbi:MAG: ribosome small subunit-dependent GTPase A, partial [Ferruginibacter sp.]
TSLGFIDRFLITAEAYQVPAIVVFNKTDVYKEKDFNNLALIKSIYEPLGYPVLPMSIEKNDGVEVVKATLKNKVTLLSGHSGVGKSSFINAIFPEFQIRTQDVSGWSGKGMHTTTFAEMHDLPFGGSIIDTPGIRELGLVDISKNELAHFFPEMRSLMQACQFNNCMHINEPGCAIKEAVEAGIIHPERYYSYLNILETIEKKSY